MKKIQDKQKVDSAFKMVTSAFLPGSERLHTYRKNVLCLTDSKGHPTPNNSNPLEIIVDASAGFIPLWGKGVTLNWRFSTDFGSHFANPNAAKSEFKKLMGSAILLWKNACPVKFSENNDAWDFEINMVPDNCNTTGCVLASAFFPTQGRDKLQVFPKMFAQSRKEQIETLAHELGHVFGLRHFFAQITEKKWRSEIFGNHVPFSIMNYGANSVLTSNDIKDLKLLYELVWAGKLTEINGTPIVTFKSYHMSI
jgi:Matrixin